MNSDDAADTVFQSPNRAPALACVRVNQVEIFVLILTFNRSCVEPLGSRRFVGWIARVVQFARNGILSVLKM